MVDMKMYDVKVADIKVIDMIVADANVVVINSALRFFIRILNGICHFSNVLGDGPKYWFFFQNSPIRVNAALT